LPACVPSNVVPDLLIDSSATNGNRTSRTLLVAFYGSRESTMRLTNRDSRLDSGSRIARGLLVGEACVYIHWLLIGFSVH
jgi:hypothetical protein